MKIILFLILECKYFLRKNNEKGCNHFNRLFWLNVRGAAALITFFSVPIMNEEEQTRLKIDKTFWKWHSPYGSLTMHYAEHGSGSNHVLFIHGFRAHSYTWKLLTDPRQAGHHVWS